MKQLENKELENRFDVLINNAFINSPFRYTQIELDIVFMLITMLKKDEDTYAFSLSTLTTITGRRYRPNVLLKETKQLMSRVYTIVVKEPEQKQETQETELIPKPEDASDPVLPVLVDTDNINADEAFFSYCLFSSISYRRGIITAKLTENALKLFTHAKQKYTHITLKCALLLTNKYAKRLYMLLSQWVFAAEKKYTFVELRKLLTPPSDADADNDEFNGYKAPYDFKRLIETAISDINRITELSVSTEYNKSVRTLVSVTFTINKSSQQKLPLGESEINFNNSLEKNEFIGRCKISGLGENQAMEMWDRGCRLNDFIQITNSVNKVIIQKPGSIKNVPGYIATCCAKAGYLNIDKSPKDLNKAIRNSKKKQHIEERNRIIAMVRQSLASGAEVSKLQPFIDNYNIQPDELQ